MTRKSKREIERRLDDVDDGSPVPTLSIAQFLSGDWTPVPDEPLLYRDPATGALRQLPPAIARAVAPDPDSEDMHRPK